MPPKIDKEEIITSQDLEKILEVNAKAVEINVEVEKQNEEILENLNQFQQFSKEASQKIEKLAYQDERIIIMLQTILTNLEDLKEILHKNEKQISTLEKSFFRLLIILGSAGVGLIIQFFLNKK